MISIPNNIKRVTQTDWDKALDDALELIYANRKPKYGSAHKARAKRIKFISEGEEKACIRWIYNQVPLMEDLLGEPCEVDHVIPLAKGGKHEPNNLRIIPKRINRDKRDANNFDCSIYAGTCRGPSAASARC